MNRYYNDCFAPTSDAEIVSILTSFDSLNIKRLFSNKSILGIGELLSDVFKSRPWTEGRSFTIRNEFIQNMRTENITPDEHREFFQALAYSGNAHGVISYLHMLGRKERVLLDDKSSLFTEKDLIKLLETNGSGTGSVIHFLSRAIVASDSESMPVLWRSTVRSFDPTAKNAERFVTGMQTLVKRFGVKTLGIIKENSEIDSAIDSFFETTDAKRLKVIGAVLKGLIEKDEVNKERIMGRCSDLSSKMRVINELQVEPEEFGIKRILKTKPGRVVREESGSSLQM